MLQKTKKAEDKAIEGLNFKEKWIKDNWMNDDSECN